MINPRLACIKLADYFYASHKDGNLKFNFIQFCLDTPNYFCCCILYDIIYGLDRLLTVFKKYVLEY